MVHGLVIALVALLLGSVLVAVGAAPASAATGTVRPDGQVTGGWAGCTAPCTSAATHYTAVNESTASDAEYVNTTTGGSTGEVEEYSMGTTTATTTDAVSEVRLNYRAWTAACAGTGGNCDSVTVSITIDGTAPAGVTQSLTTTPTNYSLTFTGTWSGDDDLQVKVVRNKVGGGTSADDDVRLSYVEAVVTYTPNVPSLSVNDVSATEGDSGSVNATFTVTASATFTSDMTVTYTTTDGTATAGADYTATSGTATIAAGTTSTTFTVPILGDTTYEGNETYTVTLSSPTNAVVGDGTGVGTITENDPPTLDQAAFRAYANDEYIVNRDTFTQVIARTSAQDGTYLYVAGYNALNRWLIEKRNMSDGALVPTFGVDGQVVGEVKTRHAYGIAIDASYMYVVGVSSGENWRIEKRNLSDGALVTAFGIDGVVTGAVETTSAFDIAIDASSMYVIGTNSAVDWRIEKRNLSDGALVSAFGTGGVLTSDAASDVAHTVALDSSVLYVGGYDSTDNWRIEKRQLSDGSLVSAFGTGGAVSGDAASQAIFDLAIDSSSVYAVGYDANDDWRIEKRNLSDGVLVSGFGTGGVVTGETASRHIRAIALDSTSMYLTGIDGSTNWRMEKRNVSDGALVTGFGTSGVISGVANSQQAYTVVVDSTHLYAAGDDTGSSWRIEKRALSDGALATAFGNAGVIVGEALDWNAFATAMDSTSTYLYIAGTDSFTDWRVEKRNVSDGSLVAAFGDKGKMTSATASHTPHAIAIDGTHMYVAGYDATPDWRIEKRNLSDGALVTGFGVNGVVTGDATSTHAYAMVIDSTFMYVAGHDSSNNWRIEKRNLSDGALVNGFGTSGVVSGDTSSQIAHAIAIDSTAMYVSGYDATPNWRTEKRNLSDGALVTGFGTSGVATSADASHHPHAVSIDSTSLYTAGFDASTNWRIEKRNLSDGALNTGFGTSGVVTPHADTEKAHGMTIDGSSMYVVGYDNPSINWRVEKRNLSDGALVSGFGRDGVIRSDNTSHVARTVVADGTNMYVVGFSNPAKWRIEARTIADGRILGGSPLAAQDAMPTLAPGEPFRLRTALHADAAVAANAASLKLQIAQRSGSCDPSFTGESYADVAAAAGALRFRDHQPMTDGYLRYSAAADPVHAGHTNAVQTYEEANNFANPVAIAAGADGLWEFSLSTYIDAPAGAHCVRVIHSAGGTLAAYSSIATVCISGCNPPDSPTSLAQSTTGDVAIATGGSTTDTAVKFTATATDPDNPSTLQLCVEADLVGTAFSGTEDSCGAGVAYSGTAVTVTQTLSALPAGDYHWQVRTFDGTAYSPWVSYGGNLESATDFTISSGSNAAPNTPTSLVQKKSTATVLAVGAWTNETQVVLSADASDPDASDTLTLCAEVKAIAVALDGSGLVCGSGVAYSGTAVNLTVTVTGLTSATEYHWQVRVVDAAAATSAFAAYGGNAGGVRDFGVDTTAPAAGTVYDGTEAGVDKDFNDGSVTSLSANWSGFSDGSSGVAVYDYAVGTTSGGTEILTWTSNALMTSVTVGGVTLSTSVTYYVSIRATDAAGNTVTAVSDGQQVAPTLGFSVAAVGAGVVCGDVTTTVATSTGAFPLGRLAHISQHVIGGQNLTVTTNAAAGFSVYLSVTGGVTGTGGHTLAAVPGTNASPAAWPASGTEAVGYTTSSTSLSGTAARFAGGLWAAFTTSAAEVMHRSAPTTGTTNCIAVGASRAGNSPAAAYTTTVRYTTVPRY